MSNNNENYISSPFSTTPKPMPPKASAPKKQVNINGGGLENIKDKASDKKPSSKNTQNNFKKMKPRKQKNLQGDKAQLIVHKKLTKNLLEELVYSFNHYALLNRDKIDEARVPFTKNELDKAKEANGGKSEYIPSAILKENFKKSSAFTKVKKYDTAMKKLYKNKEFLLDNFIPVKEYAYFNSDAVEGRSQQFFKVYCLPGGRHLIPVAKLSLPLNLKEINVVRSEVNVKDKVTPLEECEQIFTFIKDNIKDIELV